MPEEVGTGASGHILQESSRHQFEWARQSLALRVVEAYYAALQQQGIRVAEDSVRRAGTYRTLAKVRFDAGTVARLDVLRAEVEVANQRVVLIRARSAADISLQALRAVLPLGDDAPLVLAGSLDQPVVVPSPGDLLAWFAASPDARALAKAVSYELRARSIVRRWLIPFWVTMSTSNLPWRYARL